MNKNPGFNIPYFLILAGMSSLSLGIFIWELSLGPDLYGYITANALTGEDQARILACILSYFIVITPVTFWLLMVYPDERLKNTVSAALKLFSLLMFLPLILHKELFRTYPSWMMALVAALSAGLILIFKKAGFPCPWFLKNALCSYVLLALMVLGFGGYLSCLTILNHDNLGTLTFDLTFFQNALINTLHGHFMAESLNPLNGANMFRDHCDFVMLLYLPFFTICQKTETLLTIQCASIALAALPLFFLCKRLLNSNLLALLIVLTFLLYPANHSALFYDIHELSFLPLAVFLLFYFLEVKNVYGFWASIIFLLSIKLDMFILLISLSVFIYFNNNDDGKFSVYGLAGSLLYGVIYVIFIKKWLIHPYVYYFSDIMVDKAGGIDTIFKTLATNPFFVLKTAFNKDSLLFLCQIFGPLAFLPLMRPKNFLLFLYGLAVVLLANNPTFRTIHFQYVWYLVPFLFIGLAYVLKEMQNLEIKQASSSPPILKNVLYPVLIAVLFSSVVYSWQYGVILNKEYFRGGFNQIDFNFTARSRKRLQILNEMIKQIPTNALVSASENITSHFVNHGNMKRENEYSGRDPDYLLLHDAPSDYVNNLIAQKGYEMYAKTYGFVLLKKDN